MASLSIQVFIICWLSHVLWSPVFKFSIAFLLNSVLGPDVKKCTDGFGRKESLREVKQQFIPGGKMESMGKNLKIAPPSFIFLK